MGQSLRFHTGEEMGSIGSWDVGAVQLTAGFRYKKKYCLTPTTKANYHAAKIRPQDFSTLLTQSMVRPPPLYYIRRGVGAGAVGVCQA